MSMTLEVEGTEIGECCRRISSTDLILGSVTPQHLYDFDIRQMGNMQTHRRIGDPRCHPPTGRRSQNQFNECGGIEDDHLPSRSDRRTSAGLRDSLRTGRDCKRARTSSRVGCSRAFPISRIT